MLNNVNKLYESIVTESFKSQFLKSLLDTDKSDTYKYNLANIKQDMFRFLISESRVLKKQTELANQLTHDKINQFIEIYAKHEYKSKITYKQIMIDCISYCVPDKSERTQLVMLWQDYLEQSSGYLNDKFSNETIDFTKNKLNVNTAAFTKILSRFNFGELTDDDFVIIQKDQFDTIKKDFKKKYSCILAFNSGNGSTPFAVVVFDYDTGSIDYIESIKYFPGSSKQRTSLIDVLDAANYLMCIKSNTVSNINKKKHERHVNTDYKETDPELIDKRDREKNQKRYNDKKYQLKQNREVFILEKALDEALAFAKSVGLQVKDILQGEDMFSLDNKFADKFHILMEKYKACADMKKSKIYSHQRNQINSLVSGLNKATRDLQEMLNEYEEDK